MCFTRFAAGFFVGAKGAKASLAPFVQNTAMPVFPSCHSCKQCTQPKAIASIALARQLLLTSLVARNNLIYRFHFVGDCFSSFFHMGIRLKHCLAKTIHTAISRLNIPFDTTFSLFYQNSCLWIVADAPRLYIDIWPIDNYLPVRGFESKNLNDSAMSEIA